MRFSVIFHDLFHPAMGGYPPFQEKNLRRSWGVPLRVMPNSWMVDFRENPIYKWMITIGFYPYFRKLIPSINDPINRKLIPSKDIRMKFSLLIYPIYPIISSGTLDRSSSHLASRAAVAASQRQGSIARRRTCKVQQLKSR